MKVLGITAEYNPFHNGHKFHIEESRCVTGADCVVTVMSGNFTQRGETAILDKWERSRLAVENGADLVLELPFVYACSRAQTFAEGAVDILKGIGADVISFGSESGNIKALTSLAGELVVQAETLDKERMSFMKEGNSFAKANELACGRILGKKAVSLLQDPNNILALEYLKRIAFWKEKGHALEAITIKRHGSGYFEANEDHGFAGASAIRKMMVKDEFAKYVPDNVADALENAGTDADVKTAAECTLQAENRLFDLVRSEIVKSSTDDLARIYCMGEGLENKLKKEIVKAGNLRELLDAAVSKRYTEAAVRRLLVYVLLGVKEKDPQKHVYARVLAAGKKGREYLKLAKKQELCSIPVLTNINKEVDACEAVKETLGYDMLASDMYNLLRARSLYEFSDRVIMPYMG